MKQFNDIKCFMFDSWIYNCMIYLSKTTYGEIPEAVEAELLKIRTRWETIPEFDPYLQCKKIEAICLKAFSEIKLPEAI